MIISCPLLLVRVPSRASRAIRIETSELISADRLGGIRPVKCVRLVCVEGVLRR